MVKAKAAFHRAGEAMSDVALTAKRWSQRVNWLVERVCVALLLVLVLDVWLGVIVRYAIPLPITFTEELARYLMIWMALLAVSSGIAYREHIGVEFVFTRLPAPVRRWLAVAFDVIGFAFFAALFFYGLGFTITGFNRVTMIYAMPKGYAYAGVPLAAFVACIQLALMGVHDFFAARAPDAVAARVAGGGPE